MAAITLSNISDLAGLHPSRKYRFSKKQKKIAEAVAEAGVFTSPTIVTALHLNDLTTAAYDVKLVANGDGGTVLTADRALTFDLFNAARTIDLQGNISLAGSLTTAGAFVTSGAYSLTLVASNTTVATLPAGTVTLADLASSQALSNKTLTSPVINGTITSSAADVAWVLEANDATALVIGAAAVPNLISISTLTGADTVTINGNLTVAGTTTTVSTTNALVADKLITLNDGGAAASGGGAGIEVEEDGAVTAYFKQAADRAGWELVSSADANKLTIVTPTAADEILTLSASLTVSADVTLDQSVASGASPAFTSAALTTPVLTTSVSGTAVLDEDDMATDSATQLATQQSIKAYVDALYVGCDDALTVDDDGNVAGLASTILLANALKDTINVHYADAGAGTEEHASAQAALAEADASDLASLIALTAEMLTSYDAHDDDAELGAAWVYHVAQEAGNASLASAVAPTTLAECITRLNDIKAKVNTHMADATAHEDGDSPQEATADSIMGAAVEVVVAGAVSGNKVVWGILNGGSGSVTGVSAVAGTGKVTFTFSADPQADSIISYMVLR